MLMNEVDLAMFSTLNEDDLKMIGVTAFHSRKQMLQAISGSFNSISISSDWHFRVLLDVAAGDQNLILC